MPAMGGITKESGVWRLRWQPNPPFLVAGSINPTQLSFEEVAQQGHCPSPRGSRNLGDNGYASGNLTERRFCPHRDRIHGYGSSMLGARRIGQHGEQET